MILFAIAHSAMGNNEEYKNYCIQMKEKQNVTLSIPENRVKFHTDIPMIIFTFGEMLEELPTLPMFEGKASINLSEHCTVIMEDISHRQKLNSISSSQHGDYDMPDVTGWMLNNCNTPWTKWYINNMEGIVSNDLSSRSQDEQAALKKKVSSLRSQYEQCLDEALLIQKVNCDKVFIVRIPHIEKIGVNVFDPSLPKSSLETELKKNSTECYAVEFFKQSTFTSVKMLFFINGDNTTLEKSIATMADYLVYE